MPKLSNQSIKMNSNNHGRFRLSGGRQSLRFLSLFLLLPILGLFTLIYFGKHRIIELLNKQKRFIARSQSHFKRETVSIS